MYIVVIAWGYVAFMMAVAEATNTNGSVIGAAFTLLFYGVLPCGLLIYIMGTPARKRRIRARESIERAAVAAEPSVAPDAGSHTPGDPLAPVGKEP